MGERAERFPPRGLLRREVRTAVLYAKPHAVVECEYVWRRTDRWITFPWSALPPVTDVQPAAVLA